MDSNATGKTHSSRPVIGVDVGGTNMQFGVVDGACGLMGRAQGKTEADRGLEHVLDNIVRGAEAACMEAGVTLDDIAAVGLVAPGAMDLERGVVLSALNLQWFNVPLRNLLVERFRRPVVFENDVNGAVWGEYHLGAGDGQGDALGVWIGTGVGGGLILDGKIHHGDFFTAGEFGYHVARPHGEPGRRTIEEHCSRTGIRAIVSDSLRAYPDSIIHRLTGGDVNRLGTTEIKTAFEAGDELMVRTIDHVAHLLGTAIASIVTLLAVRTVFLGGGITEELGDPFVSKIRRSFELDVYPARCKECRIMPTKLAADAGLLGAALLARQAVDAHDGA
jgi:glucokinase